MIQLQATFWRNIHKLYPNDRGNIDFIELERITGISRKTLWHQSKCQQGMALDYVEAIATAVRIPAWMLLCENFDPNNRPAIVTQQQANAIKMLTASI